MTFFLSKAVWAVLTPGSLIFLAFFGAFLGFRRFPRTARTVLAGFALFTGLLIVAPVASWVTGPLEARFPITPLPARVDGVVVLGGSMRPHETAVIHQVQLNEAGERLTELTALARRFPDAKIIFTGGSGILRPMEMSEADVAAEFFEDQGLDRKRLLLEHESRNTWENAVFAKRIANPQPGEHWLLVTSAWHMPRSVGIFRKVGWDVIPHPVDYVATAELWGGFQPETELMALGLGMKEWVGLVAYCAMGRTSAWFPSPESTH